MDEDLKFPERIEDVELVEEEGQIRPGDQAYLVISPPKELVLGEVIHSSGRLIISYAPEGGIARGADIPVSMALALRKNEDGSEQFLAGRDVYNFIKTTCKVQDLIKGLSAKLRACQSYDFTHDQLVNQASNPN